MQISMLLKAILLLMMVTLLIEANCVSTRKKGKKEKKTRNPTKSLSQRKNKKMQLYVDPAMINQLNVSQNKHSLSPWTYDTTFENSRIPNYISEAKCVRTGCLTNGGHEDTGLQSKPIFYQILVLRRVSGRKKYSFKVEKKTVSVGCTCVRPNVITQI
ncbi:interleukin 17a/f3 [Trichomycterus rosablanca]|uniref:interleukin 17a/f3 n=1 Tax=Trichomycterus rosablanca TaxID=2290929 RepID=UPI002F34F3E7